MRGWKKEWRSEWKGFVEGGWDRRKTDIRLYKVGTFAEVIWAVEFLYCELLALEVIPQVLKGHDCEPSMVDAVRSVGEVLPDEVRPRVVVVEIMTMMELRSVMVLVKVMIVVLVAAAHQLDELELELLA